MSNYICKIAAVDEVSQKWDSRIAEDHNSERYIEWKKHFLEGVKNGTRICYYGILDGKNIAEATAVISDRDEYVQNKDKLINKSTAYLMAFKTDPDYQGKGYFSILYRFMENDLRKRGFEYATLGVEPSEEKNIKIYSNWGFIELVKTDYETYPPEKEEEKPQKIMVNYYAKKII